VGLLGNVVFAGTGHYFALRDVAIHVRKTFALIEDLAWRVGHQRRTCEVGIVRDRVGALFALGVGDSRDFGLLGEIRGLWFNRVEVNRVVTERRLACKVLRLS
jgi:hypothetical protein